MIKHTNDEKLICVKRELAYRKRVYKRMVDEGRMKLDDANYQIDVMQSIVDDYDKIVHGERLI